jgi:hypothetical protein
VERLRESGFIVKYLSPPAVNIDPVTSPGIEFFRRVVPFMMEAAAEFSLASFASAFNARRSSRPSLRVRGKELRRVGLGAIVDADHRRGLGLPFDSSGRGVLAWSGVSSNGREALWMGSGGILKTWLVADLLDAGGAEGAGVATPFVLVTSLRGSSLLARRSRMPGLSALADGWPLRIGGSVAGSPASPFMSALEELMPVMLTLLTLVSWSGVSSALAIVRSCHGEDRRFRGNIFKTVRRPRQLIVSNIQ